jgi:pSer/pThr/pTyr-binding forkhead associated (FHA) protein
MRFSLVVLTPGNTQGQVVEIKLAQFLVGRDPACHLRPASPLISKRHCVLLQGDGKVFVRDLGSTNGTFVNRQPVRGESELHHDDQLMIGPLMFRVRVEAGPPVSRPTPPPPTTRAAVTKAAFRRGSAR